MRALLSLLVVIATPAAVLAGSPVDFQRDIRPLLSDNCFPCHGPDAERREADLRLDLPDSATASVIVAGQSDASEFYRRIVSNDPDERMPPPDSGKTLTPIQIDLLRQWIDDGAVYQDHWAFETPQRPPVPAITDRDWARNPIDHFVLSRLEASAHRPSPRADRVTLLRRLYLDLIGLPPTPAEIDAFMALDAQAFNSGATDSNEAVEHTVQQLLSSSHYGERWARIWLDAARYADSNGFEKDAPREMWFYRDWVIHALNSDLPYDQFIIEQIAGDLLPQASQSQYVATGFLRNSMINEEGGADPEQFRMEAMYDRMDAIGKGILGLTVQCAQCHSHKYDPLTHEDYYRMFAYLNSCYEANKTVFTPEEQRQRQQMMSAVQQTVDQLKSSRPDWREELLAWRQKTLEQAPPWEVLHPDHLPYEGQKFRVLADDSILSESFAPVGSSLEMGFTTQAQGITGIRLELLTHPQLPHGGPGRSLLGTAALTQLDLFVAPADQPEAREQIRLVAASADINPAQTPQPKYLIDIKAEDGDRRVVGPIELAIDDDPLTAWTTDIDPVRRNRDHQAVFVPAQPFGFPQGTIVTLGIHMKHGGWNNNDNQNCLMGRYRFSLTTATDPLADTLPVKVREVMHTPSEQLTESQRQLLFDTWRVTVPEWSEANRLIEQLWSKAPSGTSQLVLQEQPTPRATHVLQRGDFLKPAQQVEPGVPSFLHALAPSDDPPRLQFARWLVDRRSPTTARSLVNRVWQTYFGVGLVATSDDLGVQSSPASHPELLDWLSVEFMEHGWSLKRLHEWIVNSATYQQASRVTPESHAWDPTNRHLARGARFRVDAEMVRDIGLAASGLLHRELGGPSVYPPAPEFLFQPPASYGPKTWAEDLDANRYRRALYTFRFRSVPYPMLQTFDAPDRIVSCVRRSQSNTPLQALTTLNEPLFVECAQAMARNVLAESAPHDAQRMTDAMRRCIAREPHPDELSRLLALLRQQRENFASGTTDPHALLGDHVAETEHVPPHELAAWTIVSRVLLNLDETITKE